MKSLIVTALMIASFSTFAQDLGSVDSLLSVLPLGTHLGEDVKGGECSVTVTEVNFPAKDISVIAANANNKIFKVVQDGTEFRFRAYRKEFIQTDRYYVDSSRSSYVERVIRTMIAGDNQLYVVVANETSVNRGRSVEKVECVVDL